MCGRGKKHCKKTPGYPGRLRKERVTGKPVVFDKKPAVLNLEPGA